MFKFHENSLYGNLQIDVSHLLDIKIATFNSLDGNDGKKTPTFFHKLKVFYLIFGA
jgi:hypothetical protein